MPKNGSKKTTPVEDPKTVFDASVIYINQLPKDQVRVADTAIARFVKWFGDSRELGELLPSEIGEFSEQEYARASQPDYAALKSIKEFLSFLKRKKFINKPLSHHIRITRADRNGAPGAASVVYDKSERLTKEGYNSIIKQLGVLEEERVRVIDDIRRAADDGDIRENSPLDAAREEQGRISAKIKELENTLKTATVIDDKLNKGNNKIVLTGAKVTLVNIGDRSKIKYQIVSSNEANPLKGKISTTSPVGSAVLNGRVGQEITVSIPKGTAKYRIESIGQ